MEGKNTNGGNTMTSTLIKLPKRFFCDHLERDLPTPTVVKANKTHLWIGSDDGALPELLNDAQFYADMAWDMGSEYMGLAASARATVRAIEKHA
jgi:hypothetical protein